MERRDGRQLVQFSQAKAAFERRVGCAQRKRLLSRALFFLKAAPLRPLLGTIFYFMFYFCSY